LERSQVDQLKKQFWKTFEDLIVDRVSFHRGMSWERVERS
jgi:hypothetical protein